MEINGKSAVFVVVQLNGGNDFMNTVIPYGNDIYYDSRPVISIPHEQILPIDDYLSVWPELMFTVAGALHSTRLSYSDNLTNPANPDSNSAA